MNSSEATTPAARTPARPPAQCRPTLSARQQLARRNGHISPSLQAQPRTPPRPQSATPAPRDLPLHVIFHILQFLPPNEIPCTVRLLCRAAAEHFAHAIHLLVRPHWPLPPHAAGWVCNGTPSPVAPTPAASHPAAPAPHAAAAAAVTASTPTASLSAAAVTHGSDATALDSLSFSRKLHLLSAAAATGCEASLAVCWRLVAPCLLPGIPPSTYAAQYATFACPHPGGVDPGAAPGHDRQGLGHGSTGLGRCRGVCVTDDPGVAAVLGGNGTRLLPWLLHQGCPLDAGRALAAVAERGGGLAAVQATWGLVQRRLGAWAIGGGGEAGDDGGALLGQQVLLAAAQAVARTGGAAGPAGAVERGNGGDGRDGASGGLKHRRDGGNGRHETGGKDVRIDGSDSSSCSSSSSSAEEGGGEASPRPAAAATAPADPSTAAAAGLSGPPNGQAPGATLPPPPPNEAARVMAWLLTRGSCRADEAVAAAAAQSGDLPRLRWLRAVHRCPLGARALASALRHNPDLTMAEWVLQEMGMGGPQQQQEQQQQTGPGPCGGVEAGTGEEAGGAAGPTGATPGVGCVQLNVMEREELLVAAATAHVDPVGRLTWLRQRMGIAPAPVVTRPPSAFPASSSAGARAVHAGGGGARVVNAAASVGAVDALRYLHDECGLPLTTNTFVAAAGSGAAASHAVAVTRAADGGAVRVLTWLLQRGCQPDSRAYGAAAAAGDAGTLVWLAHVAQCPWPPRGLAEVVARWPLVPTAACSSNGCHSRRHACGPGSSSGAGSGDGCEAEDGPPLLRTVNALAAAGCPVGGSDALNAAARRGDFSLAQLLYGTYGCRTDDQTLTAAAAGGCTALVAWLLSPAVGCRPGGRDGRAYLPPASRGDVATLTCLRRLGVPWDEHTLERAIWGSGDPLAPLAALRWLVAAGVPYSQPALEIVCQFLPESERRRDGRRVAEWLRREVLGGQPAVGGRGGQQGQEGREGERSGELGGLGVGGSGCGGAAGACELPAGDAGVCGMAGGARPSSNGADAAATAPAAGQWRDGQQGLSPTKPGHSGLPLRHQRASYTGQGASSAPVGFGPDPRAAASAPAAAAAGSSYPAVAATAPATPTPAASYRLDDGEFTAVCAGPSRRPPSSHGRFPYDNARPGTSGTTPWRPGSSRQQRPEQLAADRGRAALAAAVQHGDMAGLTPGSPMRPASGRTSAPSGLPPSRWTAQVPAAAKGPALRPVTAAARLGGGGGGGALTPTLLAGAAAARQQGGQSVGRRRPATAVPALGGGAGAAQALGGASVALWGQGGMRPGTPGRVGGPGGLMRRSVGSLGALAEAGAGGRAGVREAWCSYWDGVVQGEGGGELGAGGTGEVWGGAGGVPGASGRPGTAPRGSGGSGRDGFGRPPSANGGCGNGERARGHSGRRGGGADVVNGVVPAGGRGTSDMGEGGCMVRLAGGAEVLSLGYHPGRRRS